MKRKISIIGATLIALAITGCGGVAGNLAADKMQLLTGYGPATMTGVTNGSTCSVNNKDAVKVGTSSKGGAMKVTVPSQTTDLTVYCAAWKGVTGLSLNITTSPEITISPTSIALSADDGVTGNSPFTLSGAESGFKFDFTLSSVESSTDITFTTSTAKRFVMWDAQYKVAETPDDDSYKLTFETNGGTPVGDRYVDAGGCLTDIPSTTKENDTENQIRYHFFGWYTTSTFDEGTEFTNETIVDKNMTIYARFLEIPYHIIHEHFNYDIESEDVIQDDEQWLYELNVPIRAGYLFGGWYTTPSCDEGTEMTYGYYLTSNIDVYAKWEKKAIDTTYFINTDPIDDGSVVGGYYYRVIGEVTAKYRENYFTIQSEDNAMIVKDETLYGLVAVGNLIEVCGAYVDSGNTQELRDLVYYTILSNDTNIDNAAPITNISDITNATIGRRVSLTKIQLETHFSKGKASIKNSNIPLYYYSSSFVKSGENAFDSSNFAENDYVRIDGIVVYFSSNPEIIVTNIEKMKQNTVTFDGNGAGISNVETQKLLDGDKVEVPTAPTRKADVDYTYEFEGWYTEATCDNKYDFTTPVSSSFTLFANWIATPRAAKDVVKQDLVSRAFLSYNYEYSGSGATDTLNKNYMGISGNSYTDWTKEDATSGITYIGKCSVNNGVQINNNDKQPGIVVNANENEYDGTKITVEWGQGGTVGKVIDVYAKDEPYESVADLFSADENVQGTLIGSLTCGEDKAVNSVLEIENENYHKYIGIRARSGSTIFSSIDIQWGEGGASYQYSNAYLRFSGFISKYLWDKLNTESTIEGYGIMFAETDILGEEALSSKTPDGTNIKRYYTPLSEIKTNPTLANDRQKGDLTGDYYIWNLKKDVTENLTKSYTAASFIVVNGETLFLQEISYSAKTLAQELLDSGFYPETQDDGALLNLANLKVVEENA